MLSIHLIDTKITIGKPTRYGKGAIYFGVFLFVALGAGAAERQHAVAEKSSTSQSEFAWSSSEINMQQTLIMEATKVAAKGEYPRALAILGKNPRVSAKELHVDGDTYGFRIAAVAGFLRNQGKNLEADLFSRLALAQNETQPSRASKGSERAEIRYWRAYILSESGDFGGAKKCLAERDDEEPLSERSAELQAAVEARTKTDR